MPEYIGGLYAYAVFGYDTFVKDRTHRGIIKDVIMVCIACILWFVVKKVMHNLHGTVDDIKIGFIGFKISLYNIAYYISCVLVVFFATKHSIGAVDRYLFTIFRGQLRKRFLATKIANATIYFIAFLFVLNVLSVDTKIIAAVGGALSIGLGFGLQKVASNFVGGLILFAEQSIRIDDIIELSDGISGTVRQLSPRYTMVETFDGKEVFVPNEDMIVKKVINWTHFDNSCRDDVTIKIAHESDIDTAIAIVKEQISLSSYIAKDAGSTCYVYGYDEIGIILLIRIWIADVKEHYTDVKSDLMLGVIKQFRLKDIKMPAQRLLNIEAPVYK